jgi:hypothetical protein
MLEPNESRTGSGRGKRNSPRISVDLGWLIDLKERLFDHPATLAVAALAIGLALGLFFGWVVWPVKWKDASPANLREDLQVEWVRMAADSYGVGASSSDDAVRRLRELGDRAPQVMTEAAANPGPGGSFTLAALQEVRSYYERYSGEVIPQFDQAAANPVPTSAPITSAEPTLPGGFQMFGEEDVTYPAAEEEEKVGSKFSGFLLFCAFIVLLAVGIALVLYLRRSGLTLSFASQQPEEDYGDYQAPPPKAAAPTPPPASYRSSWMESEEPIAQWMTTYLKGDDLFDDSFSIDAPSGEFLGECGVGIADTIGVGEPKRVSAFEIWLFDKNDIQTVTKVLMSEYLFNDQASHNRLAAKGEPMLCGPGMQFTMETETLQMLVRVVDLNYGSGPLPDHSYFDRISLELSVWPR